MVSPCRLRHRCSTVSDVTEHSELDLDVAIMEEEADKLTVDGFNAAYDIYSVGNHRFVMDLTFIQLVVTAQKCGNPKLV